MFAEFFLHAPRGRRIFAWLGAIGLAIMSVARAAIQRALVAWYGEIYTFLQHAQANEGGEASLDALFAAFARLALPWALLIPLASLLRRFWCFEWRMALVDAYVRRWASRGSGAPEGASQRVQEDTQRFARGVELFAGQVLDAVLTLVIFVPSLLELGAAFPSPGSSGGHSAGWLLALTAALALLGLCVSVAVAWRLVGLDVRNQRVEAGLRKRLVAYEDAPPREVERSAAAGDRLDELVATLRQNYAALYRNMLGIDGWIAVFEQSVVVVPLVLCAPRLLDPSLDLTLGQLVQLLAVFQRVFDSLNLPAHNWSAINDFAATVVRLVEFERSVGEAKASELV